MEAFQAAGAQSAADAAGDLGPESALLVVGAREARGENAVCLRCLGPALDSPARLHARDLGREVAAREPELGRERRTVLVERLLLRHRRQAERAANRDAA